MSLSREALRLRLLRRRKGARSHRLQPAYIGRGAKIQSKGPKLESVPFVAARLMFIGRRLGGQGNRPRGDG